MREVPPVSTFSEMKAPGSELTVDVAPVGAVAVGAVAVDLAAGAVGLGSVAPVFGGASSGMRRATLGFCVGFAAGVLGVSGDLAVGADADAGEAVVTPLAWSTKRWPHLGHLPGLPMRESSRSFKTVEHWGQET